jgi:CRISPR-associated protein Cmr2
VWLSFSITPVQDFIAAARTVRDLKTGSQLLVHLVGEAMLAGIASGGTPIFPSVTRGDIERGMTNGSLHIPNQFVMEFPCEAKARQAAQDAETRVRCEWNRIADAVRQHLARQWNSKASGWDSGWQDQIESLWEVRCIVYVPSAADDAGYHGLFETPASHEWDRQWRLLAAAQRATKQVRHFPGDQGIGRPKCSMMGEREQMGPGRTLNEQRDFWRGISGVFSWNGIRIGERDRLCAVALVKRFAPCVKMHFLKERIPDTAAIAAASWMQAATECQDTQGAFSEWQEAAEALAKALGEDAETQGRYLLSDERAPGAFVPAACTEESERQAVSSAAEGMLKKRRALLEAARKARPGAPPRYLAVLCLDGDHIGKWISGEFHNGESFGAEQCRDISSRLRCYAGKVPRIVGEHQGYVVYAGGDDVLALLPIDTALRCALKLREEYPTLGSDGGCPTTASAGLAYAHYMHDLRDMLARAREGAREAKDWGRDALGWRILRRSGAISKGVISWGAAECVSELAGLFEKLSDRWLYRLAEAQGSAFGYWDEDEAARALTRHFATRVEEDKAKVLPQKADELYEELRALADGRVPSAPPNGYRTAGWVLEALVNTLGLGSFIARKGG